MYPRYRRDEIDLKALNATEGVFELLDNDGSSKGLHRIYIRGGYMHIVPEIDDEIELDSEGEPKGRPLKDILQTLEAM